MARVALVTGAARGIGAATARVLASQGFSVALLDLREGEVKALAEELSQGGVRALGLACDVGRSEDVTRALAAVTEALGSPDTLVNNAGVGGPFHRADEVPEDEWDWILGTNLKSVYLFTRALLPRMRERGFGRVVNVASIQGLLGSARSSTYVASKHGMIGYTRAVAAEWGEHGVTCNAVCPGYVDTALGIQEDKVDDYRARVLAKSPVKRVASPEELAHLIAFLVGPHAGYLNGAAIVMDGGISCHVGIT